MLIDDDNAFEASAAVLDTCAKLCGVSVEVDKRVLHYAKYDAAKCNYAIGIAMVIKKSLPSILTCFTTRRTKTITEWPLSE